MSPLTVLKLTFITLDSGVNIFVLLDNPRFVRVLYSESNLKYDQN